jgi:DNA mismatch endonuclease (patch repair protein)
MMAGIRAKDTTPEMVIRRGLHGRRFRFLLHHRRLPGRPDLVLPRYRAAIMVHGCFWHGHNCPLFRWPRSREEFWREKITGNIARDRRDAEQLGKHGWRVLTIWECALKGKTALTPERAIDAAASWLQSSDTTGEIRGR